MKPYQVHLFSDNTKIPDYLPTEPVFVYENNRYLNFLTFDCFHLKNNEYLRDTARNNIEAKGIVAAEGRIETIERLQKAMIEFKKIENIMIMPDELMAIFSVLSMFGPKTTFFVDYETSPTILALIQQRNVEFYKHDDLVQLGNLLNAKSEKAIVIDGLYEWIGKIAPVNDLVKLAQQYECFIIGNELNTFGLLGREGRGFIDLFNLYDAINMEIGSFSRFLGGFGCYIGAKRFLINKVRENVNKILNPLPQFMLSVNIGALELARNNNGNGAFTTLWKNSRYFITRLKQIGFTTASDTPIAVVNLNNNDESGEFVKKLFFEKIVVGQDRERIRMCLSIEHNKEDLDYCLEVFEKIGKELAILK